MTLLADRIKELRELNKFTQDELGERLAVSGKTVSSWENSRSEPKMGMIENMAKIFNCKKSDIIGDNEILETKFSTPQEAFEYIIKQPTVAMYGGYDLEKMSDEELIEFANELAEILAIISKKYNK